MKFSRIRFRERVAGLPMLRLLLPVVCGILLGEWFSFPLLFLGVALGVTALLALLFRSNLYAFLLLMVGAMLSCELRYGALTPPLGEEALYALRTQSEAVEREGYASLSARVEGWMDRHGEWHSAQCRVTLYCDSTLRPSAGERLVVRSQLRPYSSRYPAYQRLQRHRGFAGTLSLRESRLLERDTLQRLSWGERLHRGAVERIERLELTSESQAVVLAMATGERQTLSPTLRTAYSRSGAAHLLAVSGLHVGLLFLALNLLLAPLTLLRAGHRWRNLLVVGAVWGFALMTGLSPSVQRAAAMFTLMQLAGLFSLHYQSLNGLFAVAVVLLLLDPLLLFDPSFELSFLAVAAILCWGLPWMQHLHGRPWRWLRYWVVGLVATLATAPLVSLYFGVVSWVGILLNPLMILLGEGLLCLALGWILLPLGLLSTPVGWLIEQLADALNRVVEMAASWSAGAFDFSLSAGSAVVIYLLFVAITLLGCGVEAKKRVSLPRDEW